MLLDENCSFAITIVKDHLPDKHFNSYPEGGFLLINQEGKFIRMKYI
jgi:hypothetical protein